MHVERAKAAAAVPGALAARAASEQENMDRLLGALHIYKRGFEFRARSSSWPALSPAKGQGRPESTEAIT
eukprot:1944045-Pyramimonas_sp.AAC.1